MAIIIRNRARRTLANCPVGLFYAESGELCLKTEYGSNEGRIDAYIVASGEFFWGGAKSVAEQRQVKVWPAKVRNPGKNWGDTYRHFVRLGHDHGSAAFEADKAEGRQ